MSDVSQAFLPIYLFILNGMEIADWLIRMGIQQARGTPPPRAGTLRVHHHIQHSPGDRAQVSILAQQAIFD